MPFPTLRLLSCAALIALLFGAGGSVHASCDKCPERRVTLYDFDVTVPRPDSLADMANWYFLFYAAPGAASAIFTPQCAQFIDAAFYRDTSGVPSKSLTVGIDHPNTAPSGSMKGMDYLLTGTVGPDGSGYKLTLSLETACDRKKVATASQHFDRADQASTVAADLARQKFVPIAEIIRSYERDVRSADPQVSIGGYNAKLTVDPVRRKASMGEKIPVTLTLIDCDGEPLAGRTISLTGGGKAAPPSSNGTFAAAEATTGSDGKVTVDFTVGSTNGTALARAYFFHKTPFGCEAVAVDEAAIEVGGSAAYYQVRYEYEETHIMEFKYEEQPTPTWIKTTRKTDSRHTVFSGSAVFKNTANALGGSLVELEGAGLEGGLMNGSYVQSIHFTANENYSDAIATIRSANYEDRITEGAPIRSDSALPDFFVSLDPDDLGESSQFSFTLPFALHGTVTGYGFEVTMASGKVFDTSSSVNETNSDETVFGPEIKIINHYSMKDSAFHVEGALDTAWSAEGTDTELHGKLSATVAPIALRVKPDGIFPIRAPALRRGRLRVLNNGALIACKLQDVAPEARVRVELHSLKGSLLSVLHDAPRGADREITLSPDQAGVEAGAGLSVIVFRAGSLQESRVLYRSGKQ